jgi:hypothetical protein
VPAPFSIPNVWTGGVPGAAVTDLWLALRDAFERTSLWPVIRGEPGCREDSPVDAAATLRAVPHGPVREILSSRLEQQRSFAGMLELTIPPDIDAPKLAQLLDASGAFAFGGKRTAPEPWPTQPPMISKVEFHSALSVQKHSPFPVVELSLIALKHPYEAPAYLGFGGWNECPGPEIQVAVLREWFEHYGAEPAAMTGDVLECVVERAPKSEAECLELAADQWLFCEDIVSQGPMSVRRLAIELWRQPKWFFWWD